MSQQVWSGELDPEAKVQSLAFRHVLYEQFQDKHRAAYIAADYYRRRDIKSESMIMVKAAASLELGFLDHGRELVSSLEQTSLLPKNQSRLRLYLARDAYLRRDWPLLEHQLNLLPEQELDANQQNHQHFLNFELARHQTHLAVARHHLSQIEPEFALQPIAQFNLAASLTAVPSTRIEAVLPLQEIISEPPRGLTHMVLQDRARLALAEIYIDQAEFSLARESLVKVSVSHQYGPSALAHLGYLAMREQQHENAAAIWQHLANQFPWHLASSQAFSGLVHSMQLARGDDAAFSVYALGVEEISEQRTRLEKLGADSLKVLNDLGAFSTENEAVLIWISESLGHDDWLSWFASTEVRSVASRWQSLENAYQKLLSDKAQFETLLSVDAEQQSRVARANRQVSEGEMQRQLDSVVAILSASRERLKNSVFRFDDDLALFTTESKRQQIEDIKIVKEKVASLPEAASSLPRVKRLLGAVQFDVFLELPVKKQHLLNEYDEQLSRAELSEQRLARIVAASHHSPMSVSSRIDVLSEKVSNLEQETVIALNDSRQRLLVRLNQLIKADKDRLAAQLAGLQYDITRLADRRFARGAQ